MKARWTSGVCDFRNFGRESAVIFLEAKVLCRLVDLRMVGVILDTPRPLGCGITFLSWEQIMLICFWSSDIGSLRVGVDIFRSRRGSTLLDMEELVLGSHICLHLIRFDVLTISV